eukprot:9332840-Ditylum_brightwellii.AAC.1
MPIMRQQLQCFPAIQAFKLVIMGIFCSALYVSKTNQKEESRAFLNASGAFSQQSHRMLSEGKQDVLDPPDFMEGPSRILLDIRAHMASSFTSPPLAHLLVCQDSRFTFSHGFSYLLVSQIEELFDDKPVNFKPRLSKEGI